MSKTQMQSITICLYCLKRQSRFNHSLNDTLKNYTENDKMKTDLF